jgi:AcrR family transcriptional regulator
MTGRTDTKEKTEPGSRSVAADVQIAPRLGRPKGASAEGTKERILDAAEELFADRGYDGTSIRDIASLAGIRVAVVGYHFGPKDALFDIVVRRRAGIMNERRLKALAVAQKKAAGGTIPVDVPVRGYVAPFIDYAKQGDQGWQNYAVLMGRLANSPRGTEVIHRHYNVTALSYIEEFIRTLPNAPKLAVVEGFMTMVSAMLFICSKTGRMERLLSTLGAEATDSAAYDNLIKFNAAGLLAMETSGHDRRGHRKSKPQQLERKLPARAEIHETGRQGARGGAVGAGVGSARQSRRPPAMHPRVPKT